MNSSKLKEKIFESLASVLPLTAIVLLLSITLMPLASGALALFLFGALMLILGMGFLTQMKEKATRRFIQVQLDQLEDDILYFDEVA